MLRFVVYFFVAIPRELSNQHGTNYFRDAYELASLGVTESDWEILAMDALQAMDLDTAKKAFHRVRNFRFLELINDIEVVEDLMSEP